MIELLVCTLIWGASFVAQKLGADHFGPFAINCYRNLLAAAFLGLCVVVRNRLLRRAPLMLRTPRALWLGGAASGLCLFAAMLTQQFGIERTTPGVSAFLTTNYVLLVPVFAVFLGRRAGIAIWTGVALALAGTFLICFSGPSSSVSSLRLGSGEALTLLCAALFAVQILVVDFFAPGCDMLRFSFVQMLVAGAVALPFVFLPSELGRLSWSGLAKGLPALVWLGIVSSGVAYTLQNLGQAKVKAALASIIMSLEGPFAVLFGWLILGDRLSAGQFAGCALVFSAVLIAQLVPARKRAE